MAHLNDVVPFTRMRSLTTEWKTTVKTWPNGRDSAKKMWGASKSTLEIEWDGITGAEYQLILDHFNENFGEYGVFTATDTHTGITYAVKYKDDKLKRKAVKKNVKDLYKLKVKLVEIKT